MQQKENAVNTDEQFTVDYENILQEVRNAIDEAKNFGTDNAECGFLATTGTNRQPSVRTITICDIRTEGFLFLVNKKSGKGIQLLQNPKVGLCFYWPSIRLQITIEGIVKELSKLDSDALWRKRDYHAKMAAWAATVAAEEQNSASIIECKQKAKQRFQQLQPPLLESWGGFVIQPHRIEFWPTQWNQHHTHTCYFKKGGFWHCDRYY